MTTKYQKNFTDNGYVMHYRKEPVIGSFRNRVLQFKIELSEITPLIWRRIVVPSDYNFWDLHVAFQDSMGWLDYHLHHFEIKGKGKRKEDQIGIPDFDGPMNDMPEVFPGWEIPVLQYFNDLGVQAKYLYDYGDSWCHTVQLEGYLFKDKRLRYPLCLGGERACPPEDCGGIHGYEEMLKTLSDPENDDYIEMKTWVGETWDSERFDRSKVKFSEPYKRWRRAFLEKE